MTLKIIILSLTLLSYNFSSAIVEPGYRNSKQDKSLLIGSSIEKTLKLTNPSFKMLSFDLFDSKIKKYFNGERRLVPMGVVGDFNGDGKKDTAILGKTKSKFQLIGFLSSEKGYKQIIHEEWSLKEFKELYTAKGKIQIYLSPASSKNLIFKDGVKRDGFHMKSMGMFIQLYYLKDNSFKAFKLGDTSLQIKNQL